MNADRVRMTADRRRALLILATALAIAPLSPALAAPGTSISWLPGETPALHNTRMAWFRQAKFGMFIHWSIYSIPAQGEWYMRSPTTLE